jgi:Family of unknown function (DUF5304)
MTDSDGQAFSTVADEAARLLVAAQTWAHEHSEDEAPPCRYCPICAAVAFLRSSNPDVVEHLEAAGLSLLAALRALAEQRASRHERQRPTATVDKIDLSEDVAWD